MPNLIIDDLVKRTAFVEKGIELDDVRILCWRLGPPGRRGRVKWLTDAPYWLEVPSKQSTITRGRRTVESVDMVDVVK